MLLSGPARGYVKHGLDKLGVLYRHEYLKRFEDLPSLYDAIDLYIITSREEGGPKACLEAMAKGVPLITTEVGQCKDLVEPGKNAMMAPIGDIDRLYEEALQVLNDSQLKEILITNGLQTAHTNSFDSQLPLWKEYFGPLIN